MAECRFQCRKKQTQFKPNRGRDALGTRGRDIRDTKQSMSRSVYLRAGSERCRMGQSVALGRKPKFWIPAFAGMTKYQVIAWLKKQTQLSTRLNWRKHL